MRANPLKGNFLMGDANYRFDYNSGQLTNPTIVSQEHFSNQAPSSNVNYDAQNLTGSTEGITIGTVSLNTTYNGSGSSAYEVDSNWVTVACIGFDIRDTATCYDFRWHTDTEHPTTGMTGVVFYGSVYQLYEVESAKVFENLSKCGIGTCCTALNVNVILEGAYKNTTGLMTTTLNERGLLPGQTPIGGFAIPTPAGQPFKTAPWNYLGTETVTNYPPSVVDWVLVSLRTDSLTASSTVLKKAGLLHKDGHITFPDSCWTLQTNQRYFIVIEHRNHMGVMSNNRYIAQSIITHDFTTGDGYIRTNPPSTGQKQVGSKWAMLAGDGKKDTPIANYDINFNDSQLWKLQSGIFDQYLLGDYNLDADVNFLDNNMWKRNNGLYSGVPHW